MKINSCKENYCQMQYEIENYKKFKKAITLNLNRNIRLQKF